MSIDMSQFYEVFFDEAEELLAEAERLLLGIDMENPDAEDLNAIFRAAHSIKGGAATFGFMDMTEITHVLEDVYKRQPLHRSMYKVLVANCADLTHLAQAVLLAHQDGNHLLC